MERDGNWRLKAMLAAALPEHPLTSDDVGEALLYMERNPEVKEYHLSKRDDFDTSAPEQFRARTLSAMPERQIRPLSYGDGEFAEPSEARELADSGSFNERDLEEGVSVDEYAGRMLVSGTTQNKDVLWREQLLDTVIQGAEEVQFARDATNFVEVDTKKGDHPVRGDDVFAPKTAEGAGIEFDELDWSKQSWDTEKRGLGAYITEEMIDHALVDLIEENIRHLGRAVENSFNRITINELVDNANESVSFATSATDGIQNSNLSYVMQGRDAVVKDNWPEPDSMIMHNKFELGFIIEDRNNVNFANRAGSGDYIRDAALPSIANITNMYTVPDSVYNGSNTYDWSGTSSDRGAVTFVSDLMFTYMYRDLETKDFDDPIRDLEGANVRAQYDAALGQADSACRIEET
jgi:hypothetical protein